MWRRLLLLLAGLMLGTGTATASDRFEQGLLWEISRPGVAANYVFGTMHVADPRVLALPPEVEQAFAAARTFILELYPDDAVAHRFSEASLLEGSQRLSQLLPHKTYEAVVEHLAEHGIGRDVAERLKPWAALLISTEHPTTEGASLDITLYTRARFANKRIEELDTVEEQIAVFDSLPLDTQVALLEHALDQHARLDEATEETIGAYLRGDLAQLDALAWRNGGGTRGEPSHYARLEKKVIQDRSVVMAYRLEPHLRRGATFAAVGAVHLYGETGLLKLLQDVGWSVRRLP